MYELVFAISFFCKDKDENKSHSDLANIFDLAVNNLFHTRNDLLDSPNNKMKTVYGEKFEFDLNNA